MAGFTPEFTRSVPQGRAAGSLSPQPDDRVDRTRLQTGFRMSPSGSLYDASAAWGAQPMPGIKADSQRQEQQLRAYIAWVNSQLKKRQGSTLINDLSRDLQDGLALVQLIEIVAGEKLSGVYCDPANIQEKRENIDNVLQFMAAKKIRMHHITATDVVEGNLKAIMRLILALAAHFKPDSVKQQQQYSRRNIAGIAQGAAAALAEARRDVSTMGQRVRRPKEIQRGGDMSPRYYSSSDQYTDSDSSAGSRVRHLRVYERRHIEGASSDGSPRASSRQSPLTTPPGPLTTPPGRNQRLPLMKSASADFEKEIQEANYETDQKLAAAEADKEILYDELLKEHNKLNEQMIHTKKMLLQLQALLLSGCPPDGAESSHELPIEGSTALEQIIVMRSRLQQTTEICNNLKEEISKSKNDCMHLQGTKAGLQQRLTEQENAYLQMKAELLRVGFSQQSLQDEKKEVERKLAEKDKIISDLKRELSQKNRMLKQIQVDFESQVDQKDTTAKGLRAQIIDLNQKLRLVGETEASIAARVASQDKRMARLEGRLMQGQRDTNNQNNMNGTSDDIQIVRDSLKSIRGSFRGNDPQHHTIDTLEQSISTLMERLYVSEHGNKQPTQWDYYHPYGASDGTEGSSNVKSVTTPNTSSAAGGAADRVGATDRSNVGQLRRINFDSTGDRRRSPITALHGFPVQRLDSSGDGSTKVLYFTDRTVTPFMRTIPKKLGEITLRDFKELFDRPGMYRYHFKALDPEFGTVKEEVSHEDDVIPGWEGKIVAWIEEDQG